MRSKCSSLALSMVCCGTIASSAADPDPSAAAFRGVNWADGRDNFVDGWIIPSGIDHQLTEAQVAKQAAQLLAQFQSLLSINTIRLGINPDTVLDANWWPKYRALIREAEKKNLKVILACWESKSKKDGKIDDEDRFQQMWHQVIREFDDDEAIHFEIFNEPFGYSDEEWRNIAHDWMNRYVGAIADHDKSRILVSGSGYNENLLHVGADQRFAGCRLSFHLYSWFGGKHLSPDAWKKELQQRIGQENVSRTIVTEWGAPMKNRSIPYHLGQSPMTVDQAFLLGMSEFIREGKMGSIYWPGLRDGDEFSLLERVRETSELRLTNESGKVLLLDSFGKP
ncbi:MAG: cellulase [Verrucomicrobia bacterium]|nr:MAG: cellulase [Verrucomicrobiota bacterium]